MSDPNFGLPPEEVPHDWELKEGSSTFSRVSKIGRSNQEFLSKLGSNNADTDGWKVVKEMGKESLELRAGSEVDDEIARQEKLKRMRAAGILTTDPDDDKSEKDEDDDSSSDSDSDSDEEAADAPKKNKKDEAEEDENSMLDNDWDTSEWTMQEIESACSTLITECEAPRSEKRQQLSIRMLLRLLDRHQEVSV